MSIGHAGIVTRDRPESLAACLASLLANLHAFERSARIIICDDSERDRAMTTRAAAMALGVRGGVAIEVIDRDDRRELAARIDAQLDREAGHAAFAMGGEPDWRCQVGANRNALLLATIGGRVVSLDDDVRCRGYGADPADAPAAAMSRAYDAADYTFFTSRTQLVRTMPLRDVDVIGWHETQLGRGAGKPAASAIVRTTQTGMIGDCGMSAPCWLESVGSTRDRLIASERRYRAAFIGREVLRIVPRPLTSMGTFCMTACIGFDNTAPLPPFLPVGRSSDSIFGVVLRYLMPAALFGHLPWAIQHWPEPRRVFARSALFDSMLTAHLPDIVLAALADAPAPAWEDEAARYARLGEHLVALASLDRGGFVEHLHAHRTAVVSRVIKRLEAIGNAFGWTPAFWARDVAFVIERLRASGADRRAVVSPEIPAADPAHAIERLQRLLVRYGTLLRVWPVLRARAAEIVPEFLADRVRPRVIV